MPTGQNLVLIVGIYCTFALNTIASAFQNVYTEKNNTKFPEEYEESLYEVTATKR